jgi:signal peptidase II
MSLATANSRLALVAFLIIASDQFTKALVLRFLGQSQEVVIIPGFFKFVHWVNTGSAFSMFTGRNEVLAIVGLIALLVLFLLRRHFGIVNWPGQLALGLIFGGIVGNLIDRLLPTRQHVIDFLYFYVNRRGGGEIGFPAFNIADSAICIGVGLMFYLSWRSEHAPEQT